MLKKTKQNIFEYIRLKEYVHLLTLVKKEYQKLFEKNKRHWKEAENILKKDKKKKNINKKRKCITEETDSEQSKQEELLSECEEITEEERVEIKE